MAYVVTPTDATYRSGDAAEIRRKLFDLDCVQEVISLPAKAKNTYSGPLTLWCLIPPELWSGPFPIWMTDLSRASLDVVASLATRYVDGVYIDGVDSAQIPSSELKESGGDATPSRWVANPGTGELWCENRFASAARRGATAIAGLVNEQLPESPPFDVVYGRYFSLDTLRKQGAIEVRAGRNSKDSDHRYLVTSQSIRSAEFSEMRKSGALDDRVHTAPGDVLITMTAGVHAVVDREGGRVPGAGVYRVRTLTDQLNPEYVAAALNGEWNSRFASGGPAARVRTLDLEIPVLDPAQQAALVLELERLTRIETHANELRAAVAESRQAVMNAARYGREITAEEIQEAWDHYGRSPSEADLRAFLETK